MSGRISFKGSFSRRRIHSVIVVIAVLCSVSILGGDILTGSAARADDSEVTPERLSAVVEANNRFALDLYPYLSSGTKNVFFSPLSITSCLSMVYEGAGGNTSDQMASVLHLPTENITRRSAYANLYNRINDEHEEYEFFSANGMWYQEGFDIEKDYMDTIEQYYLAEIDDLDFFNNSEVSRNIINEWIEENTNGYIEDALEPGSVGPATDMVLANTIFFEGEWEKEFSPSYTDNKAFFLDDGTSEYVPMMHMEHEAFNYLYRQDVLMLEMPYEGLDISMYFILPNGYNETFGNNMSAFESYVTLDKINLWQGMMQEKYLEDVYIPKFEMKTKYDLIGTLSSMGMVDLFSSANLSYMGLDGSSVNKLNHQAYVKVDESGTTAAAATTAVISQGVDLSSEFRADHPFIFFIQDNESGAILFMGRVMNPLEG